MVNLHNHDYIDTCAEIETAIAIADNRKRGYLSHVWADLFTSRKVSGYELYRRQFRGDLMLAQDRSRYLCALQTEYYLSINDGDNYMMWLSNDTMIKYNNAEYWRKQYWADLNAMYTGIINAEMDKQIKDERQIKIALKRSQVGSVIDAQVKAIANDMISSYEDSIAPVMQPTHVLAETLKAALSALKRSYGSVPDQHMVTLQTDSRNGRLYLTATTGDSWTRTSITAKAPKSGVGVINMGVPARILEDLTSVMPDDRIDLSQGARKTGYRSNDDKRLIISINDGRGLANIAGSSNPANVAAMPITADELNRAEMYHDYLIVDNVAEFAAELERMNKISKQTKDNRVILESVLLRVNGLSGDSSGNDESDYSLTLAAADGKQITDTTLKTNAGRISNTGDYLLHRTHASALLEILKNSVKQNVYDSLKIFTCVKSIPYSEYNYAQKRSVTSTKTVKYLVFQIGEFTCAYTCVDGTFPKFEDIKPKKFDAVVTVFAHDLITALKNGKPFYSKDSNNALVVEVCPDFARNGLNDVIVLKSTSQERGDNNAPLQAQVSIQNEKYNESTHLRSCVNGANLLNIILELTKGIPMPKRAKTPKGYSEMTDAERRKADKKAATRKDIPYTEIRLHISYTAPWLVECVTNGKSVVIMPLSKWDTESQKKPTTAIAAESVEAAEINDTPAQDDTCAAESVDSAADSPVNDVNARISAAIEAEDRAYTQYIDAKTAEIESTLQAESQVIAEPAYTEQ